MKRYHSPTLLIALATTASVASANLNLFENGSFETTTPYVDYLLDENYGRAEVPITDPTDLGTAYMPGWIVKRNSVVVNNDGFGAADGNNYIELLWGFDDFGNRTSGGFAVYLSLEAGVTYQYSFDYCTSIGSSLTGNSLGLGIAQSNITTGELTWGMDVSLLASDSTSFIRETVGPAGDATDTRTEYPISVAEDEWNHYSFEFTPLVSDEFYFNIFVGGDSSLRGRDSIMLDNFSLVAVPEPETYATLLGVGALAAVAWRRKQTR
ncbi:PEP-CTERM sorting domain-containing protein [Cerasicoccus frondis]|uniref:PEP-CTERM sorting domain-containing protein n=1 Tax=Cerasicoccus frondis TaxID=490090 RepID=UPI002852D94B|nr:PEP-CTERM sorting domain-containing protein [Cerasicoccus frondis]